MAAPTQAYPPWLSPVPTTVTLDGVEVVQTTIVQFPQTYFGPSIPLDSAWVYGGSTFPASIATGFPTSTSTSDTASATTSTSASTLTTSPSISVTTSPSASTSAPTSISTSTFLSTTLSTGISSSSSVAISSTTLASPTASTAHHGIQPSTRIAIAISTILGSFLIAALIIVICRRRNSPRESLSQWEHIPPPGADDLEAAEAGEAEVLLPEERVMRQRSAVSPVYPVPWTRRPEAASVPGSPVRDSVTRSSGTRTSGTNSASGGVPDDSSSSPHGISRLANLSMSTMAASSLFFNPARAPIDTSGSAAENSAFRRSGEDPVVDLAEPLLPAAVTSALASSSHRDRDINYSIRPVGAGPPILPLRSPQRPIGGFISPPASPTSEDDPLEQFLPPRMLDPDRLPRVLQNQDSWPYPESPPSETDERATLLTARRVNLGAPAFVSVSPIKRARDLDGSLSPYSPDESEDPIHRASPSPSARGSTWADSVVGLAGFAKGLGRFSWFRRVEEDSGAGPSGTRRSSPNSRSAGSRNGSRNRRSAGSGSRPASAGGMSFRPASRPHSALLHPGFSRPQSDLSFLGFEADLGLRPPGLRVSSLSANGKTGSANSGSTVYHSVYSAPYVSTPGQAEEALGAYVQLPPDLDLGETGDTIRTVDVLDMPVPERSLPLSAPDSVASRHSSQGSNLIFPPGLVTVPQWDRGSRTTAERDVLEDLPPQAGGEWSSLRSKRTGEEDDDNGTQEGQMPGEQSVQVIAASDGGPTSERASLLSGPHTHHGEGSGTSGTSSRSRANLGFSLTPHVSTNDLSLGIPDHVSHHTGSHSSRPSQHTSRSQLSHQSSRDQNGSDLDEHEQGLRVAASHRASLSAMGGLDSATPQIPPLRPFSHLPISISNVMPTTEERGSEEAEADAETGTGTSTSRPGSSRATMSEGTFGGTLASGTAASTVRSMPESPQKDRTGSSQAQATDVLAYSP